MLALSSLLHNNVRNTMATSETWSDVTLWDVFWHRICLYTPYSIKIFTFNMFLSSCICMCKSVAMCLYTNMGTWEYSFHISDYIRAVCVLIFVSLVSKSLSFSLPIQFVSFFHSITLQFLRQHAWLWKSYSQYVLTTILLLVSVFHYSDVHIQPITYTRVNTR